MISSQLSRTFLRGLLGGGALCIAFFLPSAAQVKTETAVTHGPAVKDVTIERGEIVYINGNSVVVKMEDGTFRHFDNVPDSVTVTVGGKQLNVHQLTTGMIVERQTITTTTPKMITTVQTVTGKVWQVQPPNWVILTLENGENQKFNIPKGQKFTVNGNETDAFGLKKGMIVNAQKVTEVPETVVAQEYKRTGKMPPPPPAPKADLPMLVVAQPVAAPPVETAEAAPKKLPTTASNLPLIGLLGAFLCGLSMMVMAVRTVASRFASPKV